LALSTVKQRMRHTRTIVVLFTANERKRHVTPTNVSNRIQGALERQADREAKNIEVIVSGHSVTLKGQVHSWAERTAAQGAAWSAPGITSVVNELRVV
jgi:osmotically-inducible protein OsmY